MADNDNRYRLWQTISKEYDLPDYNQFSKDMEDATKRKSLHDAVAAEYELPDFDQFSKDMGYETQTTQQGNQNAQNAKKPQQTAQSSHVEEGRGLSSDNGYSKQETEFDKAAEQAWNKLAHKGGIKWTIEGHPEVKMVAVTDDLLKRFPQLEQMRGYQVPFNMSTGTPIMQNIDDKGNIITPDEASEQYTKILTNQDFDYVPKQETASVQIGSVVNTALSTKGGWLDRMARKSMAQYGDDWEHQKFESDGKEVSSSDVFGKVKQTIYDYYNSVLKGIRTHLMFNSDEEKQAYVDNLYKTGQLKEEDIPKANVLHYVQNVDKEEQIEAVRQATLNRQLELVMAQERFNQLPQREKGESDFDYNDRILREGALYEQDIRKLKKQIAQLDAVSDELQGNNTSWKEWGHAFKTSGIGSYHAWDLGATDLKDAIELNKVANGMKRGMQMTSSDYMALRVMSQANEADAIENAVMPVSYKSKKGGFISAPFSFGFFVGGNIAEGATSTVNKVVGKVISKAVKGAVLKAGGKKALSAATNLAEKAANTKCVKLFGMLAKDFEKAAFMENTTGAATTGAEILNRHIGTVTESDDGFKMEGESLPTAIIKGEISQNIESQTEFLGEHFPSSLKFIRGMAHTKVGSAMGLRNLAAWLTKVSRTEFATTLKSYATRAGINGVLGEYLEEVAGTAENALLVGDQKFSDLFDVKQQEEVAGSVVLSCLGMGIFGTAIYTGQRGLNMPTYYRLQHLQNKWDNAGLDLFSGEEWANLKDRIDNTPNEGMKFVMADILRGQNMTEEQMRAAYNYASCTLTLRGMNIGAMKAAQLGLTDDRHIEQDNAYVEGRQAKDEDKHDIQIEFEDRSHELAEKLGISEQQLDNMSDEDLESLTGKDDQLDNLIYDYQTSHARYQGVVDNADDEIDKAAQEAARQTDMATDKSRGTVRNATIKAAKGEEDYGVYIVSGNVATNEDGSINVSESDDMILYYDPKSGKIEHCDAMRLAALGEEVNAEETRNQAIADAKEKAIRKQAGIIDGTVGEGTSFTITDAEGNEHTYEVLADNGDGSAMITMDGNVQDTPVSLQDLQNLKDAEEAKRLEAAKMQRQQYEEEREKQNTPVEDNLDYADIINTNGNVEIAEVVDEEGNAMFPDAEEVFFVQNQGNRAKVMVLDNEGNLQPKLVKKSSVRTLGTMSVDEYRQGRQQALKEAENASEPSLVDETETSNNVVPTGNITTDNTTTDETQPGNEAEVTTSDETQNISNEQENTPKITLEDGTEVPMLEDGNPDFSQLTAGQVAELYDSQFGEDAGQIITNNVNRSKKALDKANAMTVSGGSFVEQKASKEAKDKAIAEAQAKYDSAKAIEDAYNERMLAKEEDTPEGRQNLIEKARRKLNRMKGSVKDNAQAIAQLYDETVGSLLHRLYDSTGIDVFDDTANTVDEYVASSIAPYSLNYEGTETSKGVKQETGLSRSDFAKTGLLAKEGKGKTIGQLANDLWRDRPSNLENITDQDVRNAIIDLITSGQTAFGLKNHIQNLRIAEAENVLEQQKRQADELAHAEKQKEEVSQSTEMVDNNAEESSNTEATPADAQEEDKLADMPFEAPSPNEDAPFSAKDKAKDPLEVWNNMTDEEKAAYIEKNRVKDTRLVDDVVGKKLRKAIEKIAEMMGATIQWQRTDMIRNGWFNPNTKTIYLALDSSILEGVQFVFGHEMTHDIKTKSPAMYDELKKLVKEKYGEEKFEAMTNKNEKRYADVGKTDEDRSYYEEETVADAIGATIRDLNLTRSLALKMSHPLLAKMHDVLLKIKNAFKETPYKEKTNGIIRTIEMAYVKTANREAVNTATQEGEGGQRLSLREKPAPKKTQKVYKLMRLGEDGKLYPLFIGSGAEVELGKWYDAESPKLQDLTSLSSNDYVGTRTVTINGVDVKEKYNYGAYIVNNETGEAMSLADFKAKYSKEFAKMGKNPNKKAVNWATDNGYRWIKIEEKKQGQSRYGGEARSYYNYGINGSGGVTTFAMRPGWHAGSLPTMRQIGKGSGRNLRDDTFVWVEGEIPADIDYNEEAQKNADKDIPDHIPTDGYYLKATNANKEASQADRVGWYVAGAFKADRIMSDKEARNIIDEWNAAHPDEEKVEYDWKRESGKDFNAETMSLEDTPKFSLKVYHGSGADFTEFDFDHMGEGAGSQSFGWGGYVTSSKKIGKSYADLNRVRNLPEDIFDTENKKAAASYVQKLITQGYDKESAIQKVRSKYDGFLDNLNHDDTSRKNNGVAILNLKERIATLDEIEEGKLPLPTVSLYEVDIPDDNGSNYLEWEKKPSDEVATKIIEGIYGLDDKTLDDMAARDIVFRTLMYDYIKNADKEQMIPILVKTNGLTRNTVYDNGNVEDDMRFVYNRLSNWMGSPKTASKFLSSLGFTGIKYPAGTIYGGAEEGDVNYVIFKPEDMQIVEHEKFSVKSNVDNQGNPLNQDGTLKLEKIKSVDELTDEDFLHPTRNVELPSLPKKIADAIGTEGKPVIIKKNIFERNYMRHKDVTPELSKKIFKSALYNPDLYGQNQKKTRPYNWVLINTKDEKGNNRTVLLEVNPNKDNVEIVHWHFVNDKNLGLIKKQAIREGDQVLILPSEQSEEVGGLSNLTDGLSAANIANPSETSKQNAEKFSLRLQDAINETDTEPTEAQKKSGNYKKGHVKFGGYDYTIEKPKGSYRSGVDENGKGWKQKMNDTYGYIRGKFGKDGDHLDMFINDKADLDSWNGDVFVVDQVNPDGKFDEHKVMYGYGSLDEAKKAYLSNYEKGWTGLGNITPVSKAGFDKWLDKSNRKLKPFADYADITSKTNMDTAPSSFEEFLEHPAVRYSIRNEKERAAAEDAYNFAQENRPDRYSRYAIVNMEKPGAVPQYLEKKAVADNWRRYYNKLKWGNYKLFDLDKPFEDNVKNLVGKFPETFRKKNDTTLSKINELTADYNKRKEEYDAMSNSIQELLNGLMKQGRSLAEAESVIRDWGLYKEMDSKYQNLMGIRKQLNELRSGKVADGERYFRNEKERAAAVVPDNLGEDVRKGIENAGLPMYDYDPTKEGDRSRAFNEAINSSDNIRFSLKEEKDKIVSDAKANGTYMTAPNGEKTKLNAEQWVTVRTTNFKNWFGDWENDPENASKVVDENGEPMVAWHGRSAEFNTFEKKEGVRFIMGLEDKVKAEGFFFSPNKGLAEEFASNSFRHRGGKANVIPCFLNIRKPMDLTKEDYDRIYEDVTGWDYIVGMDTQDNLWGIMDEEGMADKIKGKGYDGVIFVEEVDDSYEPTKISYCALDANQIKSAENNNGDFSADNNDIRFSLKSMMEKPEGWKQANKKAIHIAEAIERDPKFSLKNLDGTLIKAGIYFSGGGLVEEGLKGIIDPVVAVEYDEKISGVYRNNFGNHIVTADVRDVDPKELVGKIDGEVEYFHASPVCKNYSLAKNNHEELELDKETAASTAEFISKVRPKVVTIENVKGYKDSEAMKTITDALDEAGYKWDADVYNAADYGGYTNRERLIVRAVRDGELPPVPKTQKRKSGWYEAVEDIIPTLTEKKNGVASWMDERLKADGIDWRHIDKPLYVMGSGYANGTVPHAFADELLPTLRTKSGDVIVMPDGKVYRAMGRVLARVSGVSDDYQMPASEALSHTIIGNGIPTQLTENVIAPLVRDVLHPAVEEKASLKDADRKQAQLDIILKTNPMLDDYHTGIRKVEDIKTLGESVEEARSEAEKYGYDEWSAYPDITNDMLQNALETGEITIYSSKPIKNGVFVTPSYMQASDYAGGGNVYEKTVPLTDVAWINTDEGQYAKVDGERYSLKEVNDKFNDRLAQLIENPNQKDRVLHLGRSSQFLIDGGIADAEIELDFDKFVRKSSEKYKNNHPFSAGDIKDLPKAIAHPVAVFNSTTKKDHVVMTELNHDGKNFIVAIRATEQNRKNKVVLEVNQITSLYPKGERGIIYWINNNKLSNVDKEKALHFIEALQPHAGTLTSEELSSAAKIVRNFVNPKQNDGNLQKTERYSLRVDRYRDELNQWKKDNNLPKDAERPQLPVREPNESAADFLKRVKEYRKQAALWATAPTYEDHLLVSDTAQGQFNLEMQRKAVLTRIVIQDSMLAIRKAQEAIMKEKGVDKLNPAEDAYTAENRSHGKAKNEFEEYNDEFLQPLRKAYNELMQRLGKSYDNVKVYMIAKHGLERNAYIAFKYALDEDYETNEERMNAYKNYKADMDRLNNDADFEAGRIDFAAWKQRDGFIRTKYAPSYFKFRFDENGMTKDYSGLSALFDADDYEGAAADLVKEVEDANPYYTDELWYATNAATKKILRDSYNAGMMTEDNFNFVSGMYRNYIPLRGWGDTNADQVWNYVGGGKGAFNQVVKEAKGRKSLADDPIAYIENMAESAILMNNRNWVKQHLLLLA
jgi:site-specific DNA-cytosine methylase